MKQIKKYAEWCERNRYSANKPETLFMYVEIMKAVGVDVFSEVDNA